MVDGMEAAAFLRDIFAGVCPDHWLVLFELPASRTRRFQLRDIDSAARCVARNRDRCDWYFNVATQRTRLEGNTRGTKGDLAQLPFLWADLDLAGKADAKKNYPPREHAEAALADMPLRPTMLVLSGGGMYPLWLLDSPVNVSSRELAEQCEAQFTKPWHELIRQRLARYGDYALDATHDATRMLRVVGSTNSKRQATVRIDRDSGLSTGQRYSAAQLREVLADAAADLPLSGSGEPQRANGKAAAGTRATALRSPREAEHAGSLPREKLDALLANDEKFKRTWERRRKLRDDSPSGYTMAIANLAIQAGWSDGETAALLVEWRRKENCLEESAADTNRKVTMTVAKARQAANARLPTSNGAQRATASELPSLANERGRTDMANSMRLIHRVGADALYCAAEDNWYHWSGQAWRPDRTLLIEAIAKKVAAGMWAELAEHAQDVQPRAAGAMLRHVQQTASDRGQRAMVRLARSQQSLAVRPDQFDCYPWLLNLKNGTLNLQTGVLQSHDRRDLITAVAPLNYDATASCPTWLTFVERITAGNGELAAFLQRAAGMCLTGVVRDHVLLFAYGGGSNGKSVFLNTLIRLLGSDYAITVNASVIMCRQGNSHPTERADLRGKRLVVCHESDSSHRIDASTLKALTGGDTIRARRLYEDAIEFPPTHKLWLTSNHKPLVGDSDDGLWRRIRLIPFAVKFWSAAKGESGPAELQADTQLADKLQREQEGILAWAVRGCEAWQQHGLKDPPAVAVATAMYRDEQDTVGLFLAERCVAGASNRVKASELLGAYAAWCEESGERPMSQRKLGEVMAGKGFERVKIDGLKCYRGVGLVRSTD